MILSKGVVAVVLRAGRQNKQQGKADRDTDTNIINLLDRGCRVGQR